MNHKVRVSLQERSYDILISEGLIEESATHIAPLLRRARVAIVTDENVGALHLGSLRTALVNSDISVDA
ncbi:MAG: 3-dehydroquinate synthase, partial [Paracoccaceae bacterium]